MAKKISRQRVEKIDIGLGENFRAPFDGEVYWDWGKLKDAMKARAELWPEVNKIRMQLKQEMEGVDIELMKDKVRTHNIMKEMELPIEDMVEDQVSII